MPFSLEQSSHGVTLGVPSSKVLTLVMLCWTLPKSRYDHWCPIKGMDPLIWIVRWFNSLKFKNFKSPPPLPFQRVTKVNTRMFSSSMIAFPFYCSQVTKIFWHRLNHVLIIKTRYLFLSILLLPFQIIGSL